MHLIGEEAGVPSVYVLDSMMKDIRQNLFFAFICNAPGVPYPVFGLLLAPMIAAAAMSLGSVSVLGNSLRLRRTDI